MITSYLMHSSPLGELLLVANETALTGVHITSGKHVPPVQFDWAKADNHRVLNQAQRELDAYFRGQLRSFAVALAPQGTAFQKLAWIALAAIPFGATQTYGQQALAIGRPSAARAVGAANGRNPIGIIIPCHRVIGAGGAMTGYGGGLAAKRFLLNLEDGQSGVNSHNESPPPPAT